MEEYEVLTTPSGFTIEDGTVVMLARLPGIKWVVRNGWYTYNDQQYYGWYFMSIPSNTVMPVTEEDLSLLTVVSEDKCWGCIPNPPACPAPPVPPRMPNPPRPGDQNQDTDSKLRSLHKELSQLRHELDKAFVSVPSILDRDRLRYTTLVPDGKIVRVNHVVGDDGETDIGPKYYRYDKITETFIEISIENEVTGEDFTQLKDSVTQLETTTSDLKETVTQIQSDVSALDETVTQYVEWSYM